MSEEMMNKMIADIRGMKDSFHEDAVDIAPPKRLKKKLLSRITAEPARVTTDRSGCVTTINPAFSELCGYSLEEIKGKPPGSLLQGQDSEEASVKILRKAVLNGQPCMAEILNYHKDGSSYRVRIEITPIKNNRQQVVGFRAVETKIS